MDEQQDRMKEKLPTTLKVKIKKELEITKREAQMKAILIKLKNLINCTLSSTIIFKNIPSIQNES